MEENQKKLSEIIKTPKAKTSKTSEKKAKDPNKPKRGKSAYLFFCEEERQKVKKSLGDGVKTTEVTKELGARWKLLTASTKNADKKRVADFEAKASSVQITIGNFTENSSSLLHQDSRALFRAQVILNQSK